MVPGLTSGSMGKESGLLEIFLRGTHEMVMFGVGGMLGRIQRGL